MPLLSLSGAEIPYDLRVSRKARHLRLTVYPDGRLVATLPAHVGVRAAERFIRAKAAWVLRAIARMQARAAKRAAAGFLSASPRLSKREEAQRKREALALVLERLQHFNAVYGFRFKRVCIRNQKTRWGSCSKKGNLNFSYKIVFLPPKCADYLVVHELCHLGEFNHSRKFWALVGKAIPDYLDLRLELRRHGRELL